MIKRHLTEWLKMPDDVRFLVVDDHSKIPFENEIPRLNIYRVDDDIQWGQGGAKNLGFAVALTDWVLYFDIDHLITKEVFDEIIKLDRSDKLTCYKFGRTTNGEDDGTTKSVFLMSKEAFELVGGFDEDFSGHYGYEDVLFNDLCLRKLNVKTIAEIKVPCFVRDEIYDEDYEFKRDRTINKGKLMAKLNSDYKNGDRLRFKWHKVL